MNFPWLSLLAVVPSAGAIASMWCKDPARAHSVGAAAVTVCLPLSIGAWIELGNAAVLADGWAPFLTVDSLSAPLLICVAMIQAVIHVTTPRARRSAVIVARVLGSEAILFLTFCSTNPWILAALLAAGTVLPWIDLRGQDRSVSRIFSLYMGGAIVLFAVGVAFRSESWAWMPLTAAVFLRNGILPFHSWMPPFFQVARPGVVIVFAAPQVGIYCAARVLTPTASPDVLAIVGTGALVTAVYAASLALVQKDARQMFAFFFMSQSAVVLAGLQCDNVPGLTGGLTLWASSIVSMGGFGATLRALEARRGSMSLSQFHGGYERMSILAVSFLILGLACVGIPGTLGFVAEELLVDGIVESFPLFGIGVAVAVALNGITVLRAYGTLFCGAPPGPVPEQMKPRERVAVLALVALLLAGGVWPAPFVHSEEAAASTLISNRPH